MWNVMFLPAFRRILLHSSSCYFDAAGRTSERMVLQQSCHLLEWQVASSLITWTAEASGANRHPCIKRGCTLSTGIQPVKHDAIPQSLIGVGSRQVACLAWSIMMVPKCQQTTTNMPCEGLKHTAAEAWIIAEIFVRWHYTNGISNLPHDNPLVTVLLGMSLWEDNVWSQLDRLSLSVFVEFSQI
jgi:hypothetical protein